MLSREEWSIPKVMPVVRPDVFSLDALIMWLEQQPAEKRYNYANCFGACMYGQYMAAHGYSWEQAIDRGIPKIDEFETEAYRIASPDPHTFGAALDRARSAQRGG